ncbi:hypothetical protein HDZ31DRAFT_83411 [Schizophyllum fasciatum]
MSTTQTQTQANTNAAGAKSGGKRNKRGGGGRSKQNKQAPSDAPAKGEEPTGDAALAPATEVEEVDADAPVCFICAEPVKYYAVSACNHRTCHVCSLRLRALYKKTDCTFCKDPQPSVIFTTSPDAPFLSFTPEDIPYKDVRLAISCETQEMLEESLILLRFNCPDDTCDYIGKGWADLKLHARATHGKLMCDLCIRSKKVFSHEHVLYAPNVLPLHLPSMYHKINQRSVPKEQIEGGVHPMCEFCRECFFSDDELYQHMRQNHEECFVCKRNEIQHQYFRNYEALEKHFGDDHYPCHQPDCQARKFVVFGSALDLQAHMVDEHGSTMSARDIKDARRVTTGFDFEEIPGAGGRRRGQRDGNRAREPPPQQQQQPAAGPSRPNRRQAFGGSLTADGTTPNNPPTPPLQRPATPPRTDIDPATLARHQELMNRINAYATNPSHAVPAVKFAIRSYRANESSARDLISTVWNVLDNHLEHTASIISGFVDILDDEEKRQDLLTSWKGFEIEQKRQFPDLVPSAVGSGYAAVSSGRVLNAKHSTAAQHTSRQVLDRVAQAASSSAPRAPPPRYVPGAAAPRQRVVPGSAPPPARAAPESFPALQQTAGAGPSRGGSGGLRPTPWSASAAGKVRAAPAEQVRSVPGPGAAQRGKGGAPPKLSKEGFPELRGSGGGKSVKPPVKGNVSLKNILGQNGAPPASAWAAGGGGGGGEDSAPGSGTVTPAEQEEGGQEESGGGGGGGKKKGKGKQKQTLFKLGAFPA